MKYFFVAILLAAGAFAGLRSAHAQRLIVGERAPELKNVTWISPPPKLPPAAEHPRGGSDKKPTAERVTWLVFIHSQNGGIRQQLTHVDTVVDTNPNLHAVIVAQEAVDVVSPVVSMHLNARVTAATDTHKRIFPAFGVQYVPFSVVVDTKNRVLWMGNPMQLNDNVISKLS